MSLKKIEIYKIKENINIPLKENINLMSNHSIGDHIVIIDNEVWIKYWDNNIKEQYALVHCFPEFIRVNEYFFDLIG
jgi:helix-turn-helix protein